LVEIANIRFPSSYLWSHAIDIGLWQRGLDERGAARRRSSTLTVSGFSGSPNWSDYVGSYRPGLHADLKGHRDITRLIGLERDHQPD
jgi:hypothetical protein